MLKKFITEPLVHFLFIAVLFFFIFNYFNPIEENTSIITINEGRVEQIKQNFLTRWKREPLPEELSNATKHYAINEMYLREARALGMDIGDNVIDRRLRQKMDFLVEDIVSAREPTDDELIGFYQENSDKYLTRPIYSFQQVHISIDRSKEALAQKIKQQLDLIQNGLAPEGELKLFPSHIIEKDQRLIDRTFGNGFTSKLEAYPLNTWSGPITSSLGKHFIFINKRIAATNKPFDSVKPTVLKDWQYQHLQAARASFETKLKENYTIQSTNEDSGALIK